MSRIGKQIISIPDNVQVACAEGVLTVKGEKGELSRVIRDEVDVLIKDGEISFKPSVKTRLANNLWGTYASHAKNMIIGVTEGYSRNLEIHGVGYKGEVKDGKLVLRVGFSNPHSMDIPKDLNVSIKGNIISITGFDKESVGEFSAQVRKVKKPEPYKGKGIRYSDEIVRRKQGKRSE